MRFRKLALAALFAGSIFTLQATPAAAQPKGFALNRFDPAERGSEWFVNDSLDLRGHLRPAFGITSDWSYKPLVLYNRTTGSEQNIVETQLFAHLGGSIVLFNRLRGAVNVPLALYQTGDAPAINATTRYASPESSFGDVRLAADLRILGERGDPITLGAGAAVHLPTGSRLQYTSDENVRIAPRAIVSGDISVFTYSARVGFNYRPLTERYDPRNPLGSEVNFGAAAGIRLLDKKELLVGPEIYGSTVTDEDSFLERRTTPVEWLIGAHYNYSDFRFGAGVGSGLTRGWGTPVFRGTLSIEWVPGADKDSDYDGVMDSEDACPRLYGPRTNNPRTNGCPPPPLPPAPSDRDNDGIPDSEDACIDVPGVRSDIAAKNGCPPDRDNDGVYDREDACPDVPGAKNADPAKNGCPADRDGDGIADEKDACPDVPGVANSDPKLNGCPADRDGDGINDKDDACPDAPGPADPDPKKNGCPLARIEDGQVKIIQQVKFRTASSDILRESDPILIAVATILKDHPEMTKLRVEGHTDNRGSAQMNKELSNKRAASVVKWLTTFGIDGKRLVSKGFGLEHPIDTNETEEGRQNNRRVEFHIETGDAPAAKPGDAKAPTPPSTPAAKPADPKAPAPTPGPPPGGPGLKN